MAVTRLIGFESRQADTEGLLLSTASISQTQARTGTSSLRCNPASGVSGSASAATVNFGAGWWHIGLYVASLPSVDRVILNTSTAGVRITSTGALAVYSLSVLIGTSSTTLSVGQWYWIGWRNSTGTSVVCLQINGTTEVTGSPTADASGASIGCTQTEASAIDIYIDDFILDNAGFLASSKVALLVPISDNTNTNWRCGDSTTANLWEAVNNTPPVGVVSASETATTNIESASSTGTANYIANLTTYTTAGVAAGDTVLAVQTFIQHGEDITTGTKTGSFEMVANPVIAATTFTFGADIGAHGATPTNWTAATGSVSASPSVTLGTSPTMKVTKTDTGTRVGCVDFMGAYVAWTPAAVAARVPYVNPMTQLLAH